MEAEITIKIRKIDGKITPLKVKPNETIAEVKRKLEEKNGTKVEDQRLIFKGQPLTEGTLKDYEIEDRSVINFVLRLDGGLQC